MSSASDRPVLDVRVAAPEREQPQEVRLARAVRAEHRDPLAEPDLEVERPHQPGQLEALADQRALARAPAGEPHLHGLLARPLLRRPGRLELGQPGHRRLVPARHAVVVRRLLPQVDHELLELVVLLVPAPPQLLQPQDPVLAGLRVRREAAPVRPGRRPGGARLERDDPGRRPREQLAVVADEQHRLGRLQQLVLQPALGRYVEVVVRLVEQQHLVRTAEQGLQHEPLLLAAGQRAHLTPLRPLVRRAERGHRADVPERLGVVPPDVAPVGQRLRVAHLHPLVVVLHHRQLGRVERPRPRLGSVAAQRKGAGPSPSTRRGPCRRTAASPRGRRRG